MRVGNESIVMKVLCWNHEHSWRTTLSMIKYDLNYRNILVLWAQRGQPSWWWWEQWYRPWPLPQICTERYPTNAAISSELPLSGEEGATVRYQYMVLCLMRRRTYRVDIDKWHTGKTAYYCYELVEISSPSPCNSSTCHDKKEAIDILLPFDPRVVLSTTSEYFVLRYANCWEELKRCR